MGHFSQLTPTQNAKMAVAKPVINISSYIRYIYSNVSQLLLHLETKLQQLPPIFMVQEVNGAIPNTANVTGSLIFKMAAAKPEVLISQLLHKIATPFERLTQPFYGSSNSMAILRILSDVTGSRLLKTAAVKPEVLISQLRDKIATPFQRRILHFPGLHCPNIARYITRSRYFKMAAAKPEVLIS
jgi:hypothetical protein